MKRNVKLAVVLLIAGLAVASCGPKKNIIEQAKADAEEFKATLPSNYVILAECIDSVVQKIYYTNVITNDYSADCHPDLENDDIAFLKVYDLQTKRIYNVDSIEGYYNAEICNAVEFGVPFHYFKDNKLFIAIPVCREGSNLYYIDVLTDEWVKLDGSGSVYDVSVKENQLVYKKSSVLNDEEDVPTCDYMYTTNEYTIDI